MKSNRAILILSALITAASLTLASCTPAADGETGTPDTSAQTQADTAAEQSAGTSGGETSNDTVADEDETVAGTVTDAPENNISNVPVIGVDVIAPQPSEEGIRLLGTSVEYDGEGVEINGTTVTITKAGEYTVSGTLNDGSIIVSVTKEEKVTLILSGVSITCKTSAPIYATSCDLLTISLAAGTVNTLTDGEQYTYADAAENEPNAALFSKDDMTVNGSGTLNINGNFNNGMTSKNDLKIKGGTINVTAVHDGIRGKDSVQITGGTVTVKCGGDGIKSNNDTEGDKGYVVIDSGTFNITASEDGIQAETYLTINGGVFTIKTGSGSSFSWQGVAPGFASEASSKALKATDTLTVTGGTFNIDSHDDALHTNNAIVVTRGNFTISSGDDGMHADTDLRITGGTINITKSYEGIESKSITIAGGEITITASDDGVNAAGGNDGSSMGGRPGQGGFSSGSGTVTITGGYLYMNASGDGLDSNGTIMMSGGTVIVDGPTNNGNGPLDYASTFTITGGTLIAAGSSGMAQNVSTSSTQCAVLVMTGSKSAGVLFNISTDGGDSIITYKPAKQYSCVLVSTPELRQGVSYKVSTGGSCSGTEKNGLYSGGTYSGGTQLTVYTQSSVVSQYGSGGGMGGGGGGWRPNR